MTIGLWTRSPDVALANLESVLDEKSDGKAAIVSSVPNEPNGVDLAVLGALADDPKIPFKGLVEKTGLSPKTVRKRLALLLESESVVIMPRLGAAPDSGDLVYTLAVTGQVTMNELRRILEDAYLVHQTQIPPMKYLLCRSPSLSEVTLKINEIDKLAGVGSVNLSLNRELFFSSRLVHKLVDEILKA